MQVMLVLRAGIYISTRTCRHLLASIFARNILCRAPKDLNKNFKTLKKSKNKFDCLIYEMFFIHELRPSLNVQSDSIRAKVFK